SNTDLRSLDGLNLASVDEMYINNNDRLLSYSTQLANVSKKLEIDSNGPALNVTLANLIWAQELIINNAASVLVPSLEVINGSMRFDQNSFTTFTAPNLTEFKEEAAHQMTSNPLPPAKRKPGTVGLGQGVEIKILDDQGNELAQGAEGEISIKGENVTHGYLNNAAANASSFTSSGFFRTGDQGKLDEDGYVIITGRIKELINKGGEKISPIELDNVLTRHPAVSEAVSFAIPDDMYGQDIGVAVVLKSGEKLEQDELRNSAPPPQVVKPGTSRQRPDDEPASLQDSPRKRQRTEQVVSPPQTLPTPGQPPKSAQPASKPIVPTRNTDGSLSTQARPISPPSLKRLATSRPPVAQRSSPNQTPSNTPAKSRSASAAHTPSVTSSSTKKVTGFAGTSSSRGGTTHAANASSTSASAEASPSTKPRKPETLNPRLLKKSPATYQTRVQLLKMLHQEYTRLNKELKKVAKGDDSQLVLSDQHLIWKALDEEEKCATEKPTIYSNVVKNRIMQYKRMAVREWTEERRNEHQSRNPKSRSDAKSAGTPKVISTGLKPAQEVQILRRLVTSIKGLDAHGYVPTPPAEAEITKARQGLEAAQGWEKCDRCDKRFQVFPGRRDEDGALTSGGVCEHHYGKTYFPERQPGDRSKQQKRYRCCGTQVGDSVGCTETPHHVFKVTDPKRLAAVMDFAETIIAADISPMDVIAHLPVLCEDHNVPYIFVPSRAELGAAAKTKRPTSVVMVMETASAAGAKKAEKKEKDDEDDAAKNNTLKRGVKEVVKTLRKSPAAAPGRTSFPGVLIIAADISPMDVIAHLPVLCEDHNVPYIFVPSRAELGAAAKTK
ncbi:hypothetical protein BN1723_016648, partial [Verticillium longisporum]